MMAIEAKRGCGYRKVGGTYMVSGEHFSSCDRLPFQLTVCPCCGEGYRPSRALRKVDPNLMLGGLHGFISWTSDKRDCTCVRSCYVCNPHLVPGIEDEIPSAHYLEWVGGQHYKSPTDFSTEAMQQGISRRLKGGIPRELVIGKTVIFLAHKEILFTKKVKTGNFTRGLVEKGAGIFASFIVQRLEHICTESEFNLVDRFDRGTFSDEALDAIGNETVLRIKQLSNLRKRGVALVAVPDDDPDHK